MGDGAPVGHLSRLTADGAGVGALDRVIALLVAAYLVQVVLIVVPFLRRRPTPAGEADGFTWHLLLPFLDEALVAEETVRRLVRQFPHATVWCVDDASVDGTESILRALAAELPAVRVVHRTAPDARRGKGAALNAGWSAISSSAAGDRERAIVGVLDADGHLEDRCLAVLSGPSGFGDAAVGAIQVQVRVADRRRGGRASAGVGNRGRHARRPASLLVQLQDSEFTGSIAAQQTLRRRLGSVGMGGNGQFTRLACLDQIAAAHGTPWHGSLLEDFELGLHVLLEGRRTQYCHDTWVEQEGLTGLWPLVRQRSRWAQGNMQCGRYLPAVLRSPAISTPGAFEIAYFLFLPWLQLVGSLLYLLATIWTLVAVIPSGSLAGITGWTLLPLLGLVCLGPFVVWGMIYRKQRRPGWGLGRAFAFGALHWPYSLVHHLATWHAFVRWARSRSDWIKTERAAAPSPSRLG